MGSNAARVTALGAIVVIAAIYNIRVYSSLWTQPGPTGETAPQAAGWEEAEDPVSETEVRAPDASPETLRAWLGTLPETSRNPFEFAQTNDPSADLSGSELVLQGTLVGARRIAWINQLALAEGEEIQGHRVHSIEPGRVLLRRGAREIELRGAQ